MGEEERHEDKEGKRDHNRDEDGQAVICNPRLSRRLLSVALGVELRSVGAKTSLHGEKQVERAVITEANAAPKEWAVVVVAKDASLAPLAVLGTKGKEQIRLMLLLLMLPMLTLNAS